MTIRWAGGESRETVHCYRCGTKRNPLKWYQLWASWMCPRCTERRIEAEMDELQTIEGRTP